MPDLILLGGQPNRISRRIRNIQLLRLICLASPSSHCFQAFCQRTFAAKRFKSQSPPRAAVNVQLSQFHGATLGNWGFHRHRHQGTRGRNLVKTLRSLFLDSHPLSCRHNIRRYRRHRVGTYPLQPLLGLAFPAVPNCIAPNSPCRHFTSNVFPRSFTPK
jgi:hypothetical protein